MLPMLAPSPAQTAPLRPAPAPTAPLDARLRALRPDLADDGSTFRAALVLLAGPEAGFNIDRIARRTGAPRHLVAACARRLYDNGVWSADGAACPWSGPEDFRFWNDVAVAEGRMLRRMDDAGRAEWAPAGAWSKAYDFVGPQGDPGGAVVYLAPGDAPNAPPAAEPRPRALRDAAPLAAAPPAPAPRVAWLGAAPEAAPALALGGAAAPELFPGTAWLG